jgi:hypothetical protein
MEGHLIGTFDGNGRTGVRHKMDNGSLTLSIQDTLIDRVTEDNLKMELMKVQPNPFRNSVQITFELTNPENVVLEVYNSLGARVASLEKGIFAEGTHEITWNAVGLVDGIYFCRLQEGNMVYTQKIIKLEN